MKANTAICFMIAGGSLLLQTGSMPVPHRRRVLARILAGIVAGTAVLTLVEYSFSVDLGLDEFLFRETSKDAGPSFPGRMSLASSLDFILLAAALLTLDMQGQRLGRWPAQYFALLAAAVTLLAFIGYFYGVESLYRIAPYSTIALHSVIGFWALCLGILFARPYRGVMAVFTSDRLGGMVARRMLPSAILLPLVLGWLRVLGERAGFYGLGFGTALLTTIIIVTFTSLVVWAARVLNRADTERQERISALKQAEQELNLSRENLRGLAARLQAVREEERTTVAREIHDVLAQELTRLKMDIAWLNRRITQAGEASTQNLLQEKLHGMSALTDMAISFVQRIATELRHVVLDSLGLCAAIEWQAKDFEGRAGIQCAARVPDRELQLDRECSTALFRILQESLTNVARHAEASRVEIELRCDHGWLTLEVRDNGRGIAPDRLSDPHSLGLLGMRERAALLGGQCQISGCHEGGTTVEARLPFQEKENSTDKT